METYDLVSHGADTTGQNECYGVGETGEGFVNSCLHSDSNEKSGGNTVWYNYVITSAGTITKNNNLNTATESICPSRWTLPTTKQIKNNKDSANFNPVSGGQYRGANLSFEDTGYWWGSEAYDGAIRERISYFSGSLSVGNNYHRFGLYIRCVSEEKTVLDLTYMQDMTPTLADAEAFI